ncbi:hypothetical protein D0Z08_11390 [Nocardioides immobilis]|uniref:AbiEi antitoxin N-terminal domain-containing protein n=1 Tax=Nocardioides immobilis TaxID=2049295 RepID=A0A417Y2B8_9ACTN|nr:type IV toxin-antitoxin system AbiEi family antitoxin domain-containing protein [Nocardioides immobilis]RHW26803.1 hypothetical protein D0Z08_11390 [Nocardioides immobilis]
MDEIRALLELQDGVIARRQALAAGMTPIDVARMVRRSEWVQVHRGVYVNHTGHLSWNQRAWAAVLACWPAALDGWSAVRAHEGPGRRAGDRAIAIVVAHERKVVAPAGVIPRRARAFADQVQWNLTPPRLRYDHAIVDLADRARTDLDAIAVLADACGGRRTTARRLGAAVAATSRLERRRFLEAILGDVEEGTCSVLEHAYLTNVERPHGLPKGIRQAPAIAGGRRMFRDVLYRGSKPAWAQLVELDGRLFHDSTKARDRDMERDLDAALEGADTVRLGYGQVFDRACTTAGKVGRLLQIRGWTGEPIPCPGCASLRTTGKCG